jgi:hypothetical protein
MGMPEQPGHMNDEAAGTGGRGNAADEGNYDRDDDVGSEEVNDGEFKAGDIIGKILALVGLVSHSLFLLMVFDL